MMLHITVYILNHLATHTTSDVLVIIRAKYVGQSLTEVGCLARQRSRLPPCCLMFSAYIKVNEGQILSA